MYKLTFEEYCKQPAFPIEDGKPGIPIAGYIGPKYGLTKLDYFTAEAMKIILSDAMQRGLQSNGGFTTLQLSKDAAVTAREVLRSCYELLLD